MGKGGREEVPGAGTHSLTSQLITTGFGSQLGRSFPGTLGTLEKNVLRRILKATACGKTTQTAHPQLSEGQMPLAWLHPNQNPASNSLKYQDPIGNLCPALPPAQGLHYPDGTGCSLNSPLVQSAWAKPHSQGDGKANLRVLGSSPVPLFMT